MQFTIIIKTKNKNSLNKYYLVLSKYLLLYNKYLFVSQSPKSINKFRFSLLKSPHVNKKAIESFSYISYYYKFVVISDSYKFIIYFLRNMPVFSDVTCNIKVNLSYKTKQFDRSYIFNPENYKNFSCRFLTYLDVYGESRVEQYF